MRNLLFGHGFYNVVGNLVGVNGAFLQDFVRRIVFSQQHVRAHALGAERGNANSLFAISDRKPLGKAQRSMLGDRVGRGAKRVSSPAAEIVCSR